MFVVTATVLIESALSVFKTIVPKEGSGVRPKVRGDQLPTDVLCERAPRDVKSPRQTGRAQNSFHYTHGTVSTVEPLPLQFRGYRPKLLEDFVDAGGRKWCPPRRFAFQYGCCGLKNLIRRVEDDLDRDSGFAKVFSSYLI